MANFWHGQRLKKVRGEVCLGLEATFVRYKSDDGQYDMDIVLLTDCRIPSEWEWMGETFKGDDILMKAGKMIGAISSQWDPVVPPDMESIEEAKELLRTDGVSA